MTDTITPEERASWRKRLSAPFLDSSKKPFSLRALDALEIEEKRAAELRTLLDTSCEETRANFSAVYHLATKLIPELTTKIEAAEARAERAEAENARLTAQLAASEVR